MSGVNYTKMFKQAFKTLKNKWDTSMQSASAMLSTMSAMPKKGMVNQVLTVILGVILLVAVAVPIVNDVIETSNLSGISATIVSFVPVFLALGALVLSVTIMRR